MLLRWSTWMRRYPTRVVPSVQAATLDFEKLQIAQIDDQGYGKHHGAPYQGLLADTK